MRAVAVRRRVRVDQLILRVREVVGQPVGRAHRRAAVPAHVPADADARREIQPLRVQPALARREAGIARIEETGGRVHERLAPDVVAEVVAAEVVDGAARDVLSEVRLPAEARVDRDARRRAPGVLGIEAHVPLVHRQDRRAAMLEPADAAHEQVRQSQPGQLAGEDPEAAGARVRLEVVLPVRGARAERDLVIAAHDREVVAQLRGVGQKPARPLILGLERALHAHPHDVRR